MSATTSTPSIIPPAWAKSSKASPPEDGSAREGRWMRLLRWLGDRRHLREMDSRLLHDVGLTRDDVRRGVPFRAGTPRSARLIRLGTLEAPSCRLKLYAAAADAAGLRPEDLAAVQRASRAVLAEPGCEPIAGFAVLAISDDAELPTGSLVLTACRWEGTVLRRCALVNAGPKLSHRWCGSPVEN